MWEILQQFAGQEVDGALLGVEGTQRLPVFERVLPYLFPDGQVELDALAEAEEVRWVVEIKWRNKQTGLKEMQKLLQKVQALGAVRGTFLRRDLPMSSRFCAPKQDPDLQQAAD